MKKKVWILNHYASNMLFDKGGRHYWFAKYLVRNGYNPVVFCANTKHGIKEKWIETDNLWIEKKADEINTPFVYVKSSLYGDNGKERIFNMISFYHNIIKAAKKYAYSFGYPNIIIASSVHPLTCIAGMKLAKYFNIKCICEFRDLWPDELIRTGGISAKGILSKILLKMEHNIYKKSDALIFTMEGGKQYIKDQKWNLENGGDVSLSKVHYINNGIDLDEFKENVKKEAFKDDDLENNHIFKMIYTGTINLMNGIDKIFQIAKVLEKNSNIKFIIFGSGNDVNKVINKIQNENISNVIYKGRVEKKYIPNILSKADVNLLNYLSAGMFKYGTSTNKLFEYMASGKPIISTVSMNYSILKKYNCGIEIDGNINEIANTILNLYDDREKGKDYGIRAMNSVENFDFKNHTKKLIEVIENV